MALDLALPTTDRHVAGEFDDSKTCRKWVEALALTNVGHAQAKIIEQLLLFNLRSVPALDRLKCMELLREPAVFVQTEIARRYVHRPLPLADSEREAFGATQKLWRALELGYRHCAAALAAGDKDAMTHAALILQRAMRCVSLDMLEHVRAQHRQASDVWLRLYRYYALAETLGVTLSKVKDASLPGGRATCAGGLIDPALIHLANPNELNPRQLTLVLRWLDRLNNKVEITKSEAVEGPGCIFDLAGNHPPGRDADAPPADARILNVDKLLNSIKKRIVLLRRGSDPADLDLGDDCPQPGCEQLLVHLFSNWGEGKAGRYLPRRLVSTEARVCEGLDALHYYLSGKAFRAPGESASTKSAMEDIATFGKVDRSKEPVVASTPPTEIWAVQDETVAGLRIARPILQPGVRLAPNQLLGIKPSDSKAFLACVVQWLLSDDSGELQCGVKIVPGIGLPVAARPGGAAGDKFRPAVLMPAVPALHIPASILIPTGWFKVDRVLDVHSQRAAKFRLKESLDHGTDWDRASFVDA